MSQRFCRVAVDSAVLALDRPFDYAVPERMAGRVAVGSVVRVRLHGRNVRGYVTELLDEPAVAGPAPLSELVSPEPLFAPSEVALARWAADRYVSTLGAVLHQAVPGRYSTPATEPDGVPPVEGPPPEWLPGPGAVASLVEARREAVVLAPDDGVELVRHVAATTAGGVLVIAPRIALAARTAEALPGAALIHSDRRPADRAAAWARARDGHAPVVVGGRAALLAPLPDLAAVVVLAAHDQTLKEERSPRLHGLVVARERARRAGAAFLAVSPAPPLELACLPRVAPRRGTARARPEVAGPRGGPVTPRLLDAVRSAVAAGADAYVFAGRKGFALRVRCDECGWYPRCGTCGAGLTLFAGGEVRCRACGTSARAPDRCGSCRSDRLGGRGWGVERVAAELGEHDLGAPVLRVDADTPLPRRRPRPAVVVGTIAAADELRGAGAVCVADLDQLLGLPDFRAGEHALGTLHDLAATLAPGGRFLVQTRESDHHVVQAFTRGSWGFFAERELPRREAAGYPPYGVVVHVELPPEVYPDTQAAAREGGGTILGPLPRPKGRQAGLVRAPALEPLLGPLRALARRHTGVRIDVDPADVL